jgi:hypothetical protein
MKNGQAESLESLYPPTTPLREVHPDFRGMPLKLWISLKFKEQCDAHLKTLNPAQAPLSKKREYRPQDGYGMKSM